MSNFISEGTGLYSRYKVTWSQDRERGREISYCKVHGESHVGSEQSFPNNPPPQDEADLERRFIHTPTPASVGEEYESPF